MVNEISKQYIQLHPRDNVLAALTDLPEGTRVRHKGREFDLYARTKAKHKFSMDELGVDDQIIMYGTLVGKSTKPIAQGEPLTTENVVHASSEYKVGEKNLTWNVPDASNWKNATFNGYHRANGKVGTANHWLVIPLVFCENRNVDVLKTALLKSLGYHTETDFVVDTDTLVRKLEQGATNDELWSTDIIRTPEELKRNRTFPNVDGIKFLNHDGGCGGVRQDSETLCNLLAGYITHPNTAGATVLSLGCQNAQIKILEEAIQKRDPEFSKPLHILEQQQSKSERHFIADAVKKTFLGLIEANKIERKPAALSHLAVGLECGGSDGFSGISANPALGYASDLLVALGATTVLAEFPELNGVEQELINRCDSEKNAEKFAKLMRAYSERAVAVGSGFENNPSPGNIKDGLITDAMKSAGAAKKGGTSPVTDVLEYTEPITKKGLNLLCTPGNDVESTTGLAGSGCTLICFTTGLGTPTGNPVAQVVKISSNNTLSDRMKDLIDFNAGTIITGEDTIQSKGEELLEYIIEVASGTAIPAAVRLGQEDFIPWKRGISL
ncbi:altronate dehydratase family protein [Pricia sp. S334]|uniref:Altronate dehydratase family protein n=1 Tax=Pricia mediterranea TaxID=3076079 RepID=A0ABU3L9E1_9FLAO|nr:altronate dehydratase family protein [Pricia sp. S334]MDT7830354.1 altronate dehydratase family protein [Pricia sp. S334]